MFAGELDILECRLATMAPYDVHHIILESVTDNHGRPKETAFHENSSRYREYLPRVSFLKVPAMPGPGAWEREHQLRDCAMSFLYEYAVGGDSVLVADVDEIPAPWLLETPRTGMLMMRNMMLTIDRALPDLQPTSVMVQWPFTGSLSGIRDARGVLPHLEPGGWHLSWLGGEEAVQRKLAMHCHTEGELAEKVSRLVPNDDMPPWCREHAPAAWFSSPVLLPVSVLPSGRAAHSAPASRIARAPRQHHIAVPSRVPASRQKRFARCPG